LCFSMVDVVATAVVVALAEGTPFHDVFVRSVPAGVLATLAAAPIGLLSLDLYTHGAPAVLLLVPVALAVIFNSRYAVAQRDEHLRFERLYESSARTAELVALDDALRSLAAETRALAGIGVNRVSMGVQDFAAHVQQAIGRIQPLEVVERGVLALREAGIERINIDLMYGLPAQTVDDIRRSADLAVSLEPQRIAYFGYAHVPWLKTHQRLIDERLLPGALERLRQSQAAHETLVSAGYAAIGLDHFARGDDELAVAARAGRLHRNFQGYTTDRADALIGLGASAIGRFPEGFVQNASDVGGYARAVASGRLATARGIVLSADDRLRGRIIERIMCDFSADLDSAAGGESVCDNRFAAELDALSPLAAEGLVRLEGGRISVTEKGRPFVRLVAAAFDAYLAKARGRHSVAV